MKEEHTVESIGKDAKVHKMRFRVSYSSFMFSFMRSALLLVVLAFFARNSTLYNKTKEIYAPFSDHLPATELAIGLTTAFLLLFLYQASQVKEGMTSILLSDD